MSAISTSTDNKPRDARLITLLLQTAGIHDCDDQVVPMLMEFAFRYISDVLNESLLFADHAGRQHEVNLDDVKLAIESRSNHSFTSPPPKDLLLEIAREKNAQPLPIIGEKYGIRLPPPQYALTAVNYTIAPKTKRQSITKLGRPAASSGTLTPNQIPSAMQQSTSVSSNPATPTQNTIDPMLVEEMPNNEPLASTTTANDETDEEMEEAQ